MTNAVEARISCRHHVPVAQATASATYPRRIARLGGSAQIMLILACVLSVPYATAQSINYTVTNLGALGGSTSSGVAINSYGDVAGYSLTPGDAATHAFLFSNGAITDLGTLGGTNSQAFGLNDNDDVVGISDGQGTYRAFLYQNGTMRDLGTLGGQAGAAQGINMSGQITGFAAVSGGEVPRHAFLYDNGIMHDLGTLGGTNSVAQAINDVSQITGSSDIVNDTTDHTFLYDGSISDVDVAVNDGFFNTIGFAINKAGDIAGFSNGFANNSGVGHAILYKNGTVSDLGSLGGAINFALGINDDDDIVGHSCASCSSGTTPYGDTTRRAFLYHRGVLYDLNKLVTTSGWTIYDACAINNNGQIAGTGVFNGHYYAIRLDPNSTDFSLSSIPPLTVGLGGSATSPITVNSLNGFNSTVTLSRSTPPGGVSASFSPTSVTPPAGGSVSSTLTVTLGPSVTPSAFALAVTGTSGSLRHSTTANVMVVANSSSITSVIAALLNAGCIDNSGIGSALTSKLSAAQAQINAGNLQEAINTLTALINQLQAQSGKHIATSCTIGSVTFNSATALIMDVQGLIDSLRVSTIANPITGYVVNSNGGAVQDATVTILAGSSAVLSATTDITGFYYFSTTGVLAMGGTYTIGVTGFPTSYTTSTAGSQPFTWGGSALTFNFSLN